MTTQTPPDMPDDNAYVLSEPAQKAILAKINAELHGNIDKLDALSIKSYTGKIYKVEAHTTISLHCACETQTVAGKQASGETLPSINALNEKRHALEGAQFDTSDFNLVRKAIIDDSAKGLGPSKTHRIKELSKTYCAHEECAQCHGQGSSSCQTCGGRGQSTCNGCSGRKNTPCRNCRGTGRMQGAQPGKQVTCTLCQGRGQTVCGTCGGRGQIACRACNGQGKSVCGACNGTKSTTTTLKSLVTAQTKFHVNDDSPAGLKRALLLKADMLYKNENLSLMIAPQEKGHDKEIHYTLNLPFGTLLITDGEKSYELDIIGRNALIAECPPILDDYMRAERGQLKQVATHKAVALSALKNLTQKRLFREAFIAGARATESRAASILAKRYRYTTNANTHLENVRYAKRALHGLTRRTRYSSLVYGLVGAGLLQALYNFTPLREVLTQPPNMAKEAALDIGVFLLGLILNIALVEFMGRKSLKSTLRALTGQAVKGGINFQRGHTTWISLVANIVLVFAIWCIAIFGLGETMPSWLSFLN